MRFPLGGQLWTSPADVANDQLAALRLAAAKMPVKSEFVTRQSQEARVGKMTVPTQLIKSLPEGQPTDNATAKMPSDSKTGTVAENVSPGEAQGSSQ